MPGIEAQQEIASQEFIARIKQAGCDCRVIAYPHPYEEVKVWRRLRKLFNQWLDSLIPPTAVYVEYPVIGQLVANMCRDRGLSVPQDVAILCGVDFFQCCEHSTPELTSLDFNLRNIGFEAAKLLDRLMDGKPAPKKPILIPPTGIIQRASTDFFAVENGLVSEALRFIAANLHRPIDVNHIVEAMNTSSSTLERAFNKHLGVPMSVELTRLRLEKAKRMLTEPTKRSLMQIAQATGLRDDRNLCRVFKREVGSTPGAYRKRILGERQRAERPARAIDCEARLVYTCGGSGAGWTPLR